MQSVLVFTFICKDKTGIVEQFAGIVNTCKGNWLKSRMTKLAGRFTGIVQVSIDQDHAEQLSNALLALNSNQLSLIVDIQQLEKQPDHTHLVKLSMIGLDRPGIVKEFAQSLMQRQLNVVEFNSFTEPAAMAGSLLFKATATIEVNDLTQLNTFRDDIEKIANQLDIDYSIDTEFEPE